MWYTYFISTLSSARIEYRIPIPMVVGSNPSGRENKRQPNGCLLFSRPEGKQNSVKGAALSEKKLNETHLYFLPQAKRGFESRGSHGLPYVFCCNEKTEVPFGR